MSTLSKEEERLAIAALEENRKLRQFLSKISNEGHTRNEMNDSSMGNEESTFLLERRNNILRGEIEEIQNRLLLYDFSAAEVIHEFNSLQAKRAQLRNETEGLRNIKIHQMPKVREVGHIAKKQTEMRHTAEEKNRAVKEEIRRLKETKDAEMESMNATLRKEAHLKAKLGNIILPSQAHDPRALKAAIAAKDKKIRELEDDISKFQNTQTGWQDSGDESDYPDLEKLRAEHDALAAKLHTMRYAPDDN